MWSTQNRLMLLAVGLLAVLGVILAILFVSSGDGDDSATDAAGFPEEAGSDDASQQEESEASETRTDRDIAESALITLQDLSPGWIAAPPDDDSESDAVFREVVADTPECDGLEDFFVSESVAPGETADAESPDYERADAEIDHSVTMYESIEAATTDLALGRDERLFDCARLFLPEAFRRLFPQVDSFDVEVTQILAIEAGEEAAAFRIITTLVAADQTAQVVQELHGTRVGRAASFFAFSEVDGTFDPVEQERLILLAADRLATALGENS